MTTNNDQPIFTASMYGSADAALRAEDAYYEQRARELLAAEFEHDGMPMEAGWARDGDGTNSPYIRAIAAALRSAGQPTVKQDLTHQQPSTPVTIDVEQMLRDCVPGGSICDPQQIADAIREWFEQRPQPSAAEPVAWRWRTVVAGRQLPWHSTTDAEVAEKLRTDGVEVGPLYTDPPAPRESDLSPAAIYGLMHDRWQQFGYSDEEMKARACDVSMAIEQLGIGPTPSREAAQEPLWSVVDRMLVDAFALGAANEPMDMLAMRRRFDEAHPAPQQRESASTSTDALPCPFCGSQAEIEQIHTTMSGWLWQVGCSRVDSDGAPDCPAYFIAKDYSRKKDAIAAWNRRASTAPLRPVTDEDVSVALGEYGRELRFMDSREGMRHALESFRSRLAGEGA